VLAVVAVQLLFKKKVFVFVIVIMGKLAALISGVCCYAIVLESWLLWFKEEVVVFVAVHIEGVGSCCLRMSLQLFLSCCCLRIEVVAFCCCDHLGELAALVIGRCCYVVDWGDCCFCLRKKWLFLWLSLLNVLAVIV